MKKPETGYTKSMDLLVQRFKERHDSQNTLHKDLQARLNDLTGQLNALEVIRQNRDPLASPDAHALKVGQAASRLRFLAEEAEKVITSKAKEAEGSFEAALRENSGLKPGPYAPEIRQRLHDLKPGEKVKAIQSLIEGKDGSSLSAIFDAPTMLSGLSATDISTYKEQYYKVAVPEIVKARDTYRDLTEHVQTAIKTSLSAASEYSDSRKLRELEEREVASARAQDQLKGA